MNKDVYEKEAKEITRIMIPSKERLKEITTINNRGNWINKPDKDGIYWVSPLHDGFHSYPIIKTVIDFDRPERGLEVQESTCSYIPVDVYCRNYLPDAKWLYIEIPDWRKLNEGE